MGNIGTKFIKDDNSTNRKSKGEDGNSFFQYQAHKNILQELNEETNKQQEEKKNELEEYENKLLLLELANQERYKFQRKGRSILLKEYLTNSARRSNSSSESTLERRWLPLLYHGGSHTPPSVIEIAKRAGGALMSLSATEIAAIGAGAASLMFPAPTVAAVTVTVAAGAAGAGIGAVKDFLTNSAEAIATERGEGTTAELANQERYKLEEDEGTILLKEYVRRISNRRGEKTTVLTNKQQEEKKNGLEEHQSNLFPETGYCCKSSLKDIDKKLTAIEITDELKHSSTEQPEDFQSLVIYPEPYLFDDRDVRIINKVEKTIKMRYCPSSDYNEFSESIKEEGLCISSPIIQFEDFDDLLSIYCKKIQIRHNIYEWKNYRKCFVRCYPNINDKDTYNIFEAEMCKDYITLRGSSGEPKNGKRESVRTSTDRQANQSGGSSESGGSGSGSNDEGYVESDGSQRQKVCSVFHVAAPEDICNVHLYLTRKIHDDHCPEHKTSLYAVIDQDLNVKKFIETELTEDDMELAATKIRVAIFKDQTYTPILGESEKTNPEISWDEAHPFMSFSYHMLNQKRGFSKIEKQLPPLKLYCDERKYFMLRLKSCSSHKLPEDHIFHYGAEINLKVCSRFSAKRQSIGQASRSSSSPPDTSEEVGNIDEAQGDTESNPFLLPRSPQALRIKACIRKKIKSTTRTRRSKDEINQGSGGFQCPYCPAKLTRHQTYRDHISKFHPQHDQNINVPNIKDERADTATLYGLNNTNGNTSIQQSTPLAGPSDIVMGVTQPYQQNTGLTNDNSDQVQVQNQVWMNEDGTLVIQMSDQGSSVGTSTRPQLEPGDQLNMEVENGNTFTNRVLNQGLIPLDGSHGSEVGGQEIEMDQQYSPSDFLNQL